MALSALPLYLIKQRLIPPRKKSDTASLGTRGGFPVRRSLKTSGLAESAPKPQLRPHTDILLSNNSMLYMLSGTHKAELLLPGKAFCENSVSNHKDRVELIDNTCAKTGSKRARVS